MPPTVAAAMMRALMRALHCIELRPNGCDGTSPLKLNSVPCVMVGRTTASNEGGHVAQGKFGR